MLSPRRDDGSITVLLIGYVVIVIVLVIAAIDVSAVFLARRTLSSAADAAALAAAQGVDKPQLYSGSGLGCGDRLPLDPARAADLAGAAVDDDRTDLRNGLATLDAPTTTVAAGTATVSLSGQVRVPFGRVLGWLDPSLPNGLVPITETASAQSPVVGAAGC